MSELPIADALNGTEARAGIARRGARGAAHQGGGALVTHPRHRLNPIIHAPTRFSIMAALMAADKVEFRFVRDAVELSDSALSQQLTTGLSQQLTTLEQAGYVEVTKGQVGRRPRGVQPAPGGTQPAGGLRRRSHGRRSDPAPRAGPERG
jgi:DNA-binding transcriptional ArsR family regulator